MSDIGVADPSGRGQELGDERRELRAIAAQRLTLAGDDQLQVRHRVNEVIVHDHVVEFAVVGHVRRCVGEPPRGGLLATESAEPTLEDGYVWLMRDRRVAPAAVS